MMRAAVPFCQLCTYIFLILLSGTVYSDDSTQCTLPGHFRGEFFSIDHGKELNTVINDDSWQDEVFEGTCYQRQDINSTIPGIVHSYIIFHSGSTDCYKCIVLYYRTPNINQYRQSACQSLDDPSTALTSVCSDISAINPLSTFFRKAVETVNCKGTIEGIYHHVYEEPESWTSVCKDPDNRIIACQEPGSPYVDNEVFHIFYAECGGFLNRESLHMRMQCLGTWEDEEGNVFSGVADIGDDELRSRFRCLITRYDQENKHNHEFLFSMSHFADCSVLKTYDYGPIIHTTKPVKGDWHAQDGIGGCNFPMDYIGHWYYPSKNYDVMVNISRTMIYFKTIEDAYRIRESYYTCVRSLETRYLLRVTTVGKCEIDYICFDMRPRHQNIIRWRISKPFRLGTQEQQIPDHMTFMFRQACDWTSFTYDRDDVNYLYNTFILHPPVPMPCPVRGRFVLEQSGPETELIRTRIRGITERPRHLTDCRQFSSLLYSCDENPSKMMLDVEYCESLDHTGRPIGEYDEPDFELTCVGQWDENWKSYLITWDAEDETSPYRCWHYERTDWRHVKMVRSTAAYCLPSMDIDTLDPVNGASLNLKLTEAERLFDDCTMNYIEGAPWSASRYETVQNLSRGSTTSSCTMFTFVPLLLSTYFYVHLC